MCWELLTDAGSVRGPQPERRGGRDHRGGRTTKISAVGASACRSPGSNVARLGGALAVAALATDSGPTQAPRPEDVYCRDYPTMPGCVILV
jgi:hypothetical protein